MRKFLLIVLVIIGTLALAQIALAKGPADMVTVSGPGLDGEFSTTRADIVLDVSLGYFESACQEPVGDIELLDQGYTIRRYYQINDGSFHMHDGFTYYPRDNQQGVVNSIHFEDTSSGYPANWTCASEVGENAFLRLLAEAETQPYLMLAQEDGILRITDPQSLVQVGEIDLAAAYPSHIRTEAGGTALRYQSYDGALMQQLMLNLESGVQCMSDVSSSEESGDQQVIASGDGRWRASITQSADVTAVELEHMSMWTAVSLRFRRDTSAAYSGAWDTSGIRFYLTDGTTLYRFEPLNEGRRRENTLSLSDAVTGGVPLEIAGVIMDIVYLYYPLGQEDAAQESGAIPGGIFVVNALTGEEIDHLQPEISFTRVILTDEGLYGVQAQNDTSDTQVYALDRDNGSIMAEEMVGASIWDAAYGTLNPGLLSSAASPASVENCPDGESSPFISAQIPPVSLSHN
jgi:hypothetical protein